MTETDWQPLSQRMAGRPLEGPVEGVPPYLYRPLQEWLYQVLQHTDGPVLVLGRRHAYSDLTREVMVRLRLDSQPWLLEADDPRFLDAIDAAMRWTDWKWRGHGDLREALPHDLERILAAANSVWRVSDQFLGLERRIDATATEAVAEVIRSANDQAADHLRTAWALAYGHDPDPDGAYSEAVKAVEAVACPLVSPNNNRATLGTVKRDLSNQANNWELALCGSDGKPSGVDRLIGMLALLWEGQSRHAGSPYSRRQTQTEAEAAVHLAATLVQWLTTGVLVRKPSP